MVKKIVKIILAGLIVVWFAYMAFSGEDRVQYCLKIADGFYIQELQYDIHGIKSRIDEHKLESGAGKLKAGDWVIVSERRRKGDPPFIVFGLEFPVDRYGFNNDYFYGLTNEQYFISSKYEDEESWWNSKVYSNEEEWVAELDNIGISDYEPLLDPRQEVLKYPLKEVDAYNFGIMAGFLGVSDSRWLGGFLMLSNIFYFILGLFVKEKSMKYWILITSWLIGMLLCNLFYSAFPGEPAVIFFLVILFPLISLLLYKIGNLLYLARQDG